MKLSFVIVGLSVLAGEAVACAKHGKFCGVNGELACECNGGHLVGYTATFIMHVTNAMLRWSVSRTGTPVTGLIAVTAPSLRMEVFSVSMGNVPDSCIT